MSLPYWVLNESVKRKKEQAFYGELLPLEITLKYLDDKGRLRFKTKRLGPELSLKFRDLAKLVKEIEDESGKSLKKSFDGWFPSDAIELDLKPEFSEAGDYLGLKEEHEHLRSRFIEYDGHG